MSKVIQWIEQELAASEAALKRERAEADLNRRITDAKKRLQTEKGRAAQLVSEAERGLSPKPEIGKNSAGKDSSGCALAFLIWIIGTFPLVALAEHFQGPHTGHEDHAFVRVAWFLLSWPISYFGIPLLRQVSWSIERNNIMGNARASADRVVCNAQAAYDAEMSVITQSMQETESLKSTDHLSLKSKLSKYPYGEWPYGESAKLLKRFANDLSATLKKKTNRSSDSEK